MDFISTHIYPTDPLGFEGANTEEQLANSPRDFMRDRAKLVREALARTARLLHGMEHLLESAGSITTTSRSRAAYAAKDRARDRSLSWTATASGPSRTSSRRTTSHRSRSMAGSGLLNLYGVPKPVYRAFQLLHGLGNELFPVDGTHDTVDAWVVRNGRSITGDSHEPRPAAPRHRDAARGSLSAPTPDQAYRLTSSASTRITRTREGGGGRWASPSIRAASR